MMQRSDHGSATKFIRPSLANKWIVWGGMSDHFTLPIA